MNEVTDQDNLSVETKELDLTNMTREEALEYMGLSSNADIKEIEDRFWQMSKKYRGKDDPESLKMEDEIAAVFEIANGTRDRELSEKQVRESEPKYFGKTKAEWKNIYDYTWYKVLIGLAVVVAAVVVIVSLFDNSATAYAVVVFGNMYFDDTYMLQALEDAGATHPYVGTAQVIVPNDEDFVYSDAENAKFDAMFYMDPSILIADNKTYPYYFSTFKDLTPLYDDIMAGLTDEAKAGITPVYMSEQEAVEYQNIQSLYLGYDEEDLDDPSLYSSEPVLIGFEITDPALAAKMGVDCMWHSRETTLIFCEYSNYRNDERDVFVMTTLINSAFE